MRLHSLVVSAFLASQLTAQQPLTRVTVDKLMRHYNAGAYDSAYTLLGRDFRKTFPKEKFTAMLSESLHGRYGIIADVAFTQEKGSWQCFNVRFERCVMQMNLALDSTGRIGGLQFVPLPSPVKSKLTGDNPLKDGIDSIVEKAALSYMRIPEACGLSLAVVTGAVTRFYNYGETARGSGELPAMGSVYELGSVTQIFSGDLLARAITENTMNAGEDVRKYLPERFPNLQKNGKTIQLKHLISHCSGLPHVPHDLRSAPGFDSLDPYRQYNREMLVKYLTNTTLLFEPGIRHEYSATGLALLAMALESTYQKDFESIVKEKVLDPLKLSGTSFPGPSQPAVIQGYNHDGQPARPWNMNVFNAAGGLRSNARDLSAFIQYQLNDHDEVVRLSRTLLFSKREQMTYGWFLSRRKTAGNISRSYDLCWHSGGTPGSACFVGLIPDKKTGIVILSNASIPADRTAVTLLDELAR